MIIDIHTHLGDILNPDGGALIPRRGIRKRIFLDVIALSEAMNHGGLPAGAAKWVYGRVYTLVTRASRARNAAATLENLRRSLDAAGVGATACMPIPPYLTFADLNRARKEEPRIIPFTGMDFRRMADVEAALNKDVAAGAKGLKLHPIIQKRPLTDAATFAAVEAFSAYRLPVLFHCGRSSYYLEPEKSVKEDARLGNIPDAAGLAAAFPDVTFIAGHAGLYQYREVIGRLSPLKNVMVDTSFQSPSRVRELIRAFGPERVMYASDWPFGSRQAALRTVRKACRGDKALENRLLFENAASVLGC